MVYQIKVTVDAENDLDDIYFYITEKILSSQVAKQTLQKILLFIHHFAEFPEMGIDVLYRLNGLHNVRMIISGNYFIFYRYYDNTVEILRVLYQKRDWLALFHS